MAKAPRPGRVKTRLSETLPSAAVLALYRCLLDDTFALAKSLKQVEVAVMCPDQDRDELAQLAGDHVEVVTQKGEGLAAGLTSVFRHFTGGGRCAIAFNSDSPHLPGSVLEDAFQLLASHDLVVGPTHDGGYYLVGAKTEHASLFENDGMGTGSALDRLLARTRMLRLSTGFTQSFYDIDIANDLVLLAQELSLAPERAPRTAGWLAEWQQTIKLLRHSAGSL
jgi:rSAM/selenodomain-associated transferase 1